MLATYLANIKSSGIYRFTFDKSELPGGTLQTARLVVGYSEKGPFNTVVYIKNAAQFKETYGGISKKLERYGDFFHRTALQCLTKEPIYCLNLKPFSDEKVGKLSFIPGTNATSETASTDTKVTDIFDTSRFWTLDPEKLDSTDKYISICATDTAKCSNTVFMRPSNKDLAGRMSLREWYNTYNGGEYPDYLTDILDTPVNDYLMDVYVFRGKFSDDFKALHSAYFKNGKLNDCITTATNSKKDALEALSALDDSGFIAKYTGSTIPYFKNTDGSYYSIDLLFNDDNSVHQMMMRLNEDYLNADTLKTKNILRLHGVVDCAKDICKVTPVLPGNAAISLGDYKENANYISYSYNTTDNTWSAADTTKKTYGNTTFTEIKFSTAPTVTDNQLTVTANGCPIKKDDWFSAAAAGGYVFDSLVRVTDISKVNSDGKITITFSGTPNLLENTRLIRYDCHSVATHVCNDGVYIPGYTYSTASMNPGTADSKSWIQKCYATISAYTGLYEALTNGTDVDYRYIVDTFEGTKDQTGRAVLATLAKDKGNAFVIANFPSMKTLGGGSVSTVVPQVALPGDDEGASFMAYYTPVKVTDNGIKTTIPVAGLVSNLFMDKYTSRQPYYIVAGPNYGVISVTGLVGPEYNFTRDDLDILEPYGVNALIYKPTRGTFINSNQTAKQTPVTALSKINVRELVIYLQDTIADMLQGYQWELNTSTLRDNIKAKADAICEKIMANGGLYDYENVCDSSNNTDEVIDNEMVVLSTSIEPAKGAGKMVHELTIYSTGKMRSTTSD